MAKQIMKDYRPNLFDNGVDMSLLLLLLNISVLWPLTFKSFLGLGHRQDKS